MNIKFRFLAAAVALAMAAGGGVSVQAATDDQSTGAWFVELDSSVNEFRSKARASGIEYSERYVYTRIWKGLSVKATAEAASALGRLEGVKAVFPVLEVTRGPVEAASPELVHALAMTGADVAQDELDLRGRGVKVAVMDTGIDYHHPDLGGGFGPGRRVAVGYDFVGDRFNASSSGGDLIPHPDNDPDDCNGHGTHVAGIIGASGDPETGGARGVAPGVTFGAYRVFGCAGSTTADIMLAAMERALNDGMHVLNMSIGSAFQTWPQYPTAAGADALVEAGMVVVASIGNSGASGVYSASAPGVGRKVIGVASLDNSHVVLPIFTATPDGREFGYSQATGAPAAPTSGTSSLARTGTNASVDDACTALPAGSLTGKYALIRRLGCTFYVKSKNAEAAGAEGVIIYNHLAGLQNITVAPPTAADPPVGIPVVSVAGGDGVELDNRVATGVPVTLTWTDETRSFVNPTAGLASSFTSYGLTAELGLKPDIAAPGGLIRSTWPLEAGGYATISGTSMASPHVAGAAALYLEAHPGTPAADIQTALQNSADPTVFSTTPFLDSVHRQGAGLVDIDDAISADTAVTPSKIALGEGTGGTAVLRIANNSAETRTYSLAHGTGDRAVGTFRSTFAPSRSTAGATVSFSQTSVTLAPGATEEVGVTFTTPALINGYVYGGFIRVSGGGKTYRVPYAGFWGDYQAIQVLAAGGCSFPGIFKRGGETTCGTATTAPKLDIAVTRQAEGATFDIEEFTDRPVILYHRAHQSRRLEIRALDVATNESHLVAFSDYVTRNAANGISFVAGGFSTYTWDGKHVVTNAKGVVNRRELPSGAYKLQVVVTKALADVGNDAHIETWTSPTIVITR